MFASRSLELSKQDAADDVNAAAETSWQMVEYGIFASSGSGRKAHFAAVQASMGTNNSSNAKNSEANPFQYDPLQPDFPSWVPPIFCNGWMVAGIAIFFCLVLSLLVLGKRKFLENREKWAKWWDMNENIRSGLMYTRFSIHVLNGLFSVVGPIFILRTLSLDVTVLGALALAEQALQIFAVHLSCGAYLASAGHKAAQGRAVLLLALSAGAVAVLPLFPSGWLEANPWSAFVCFLISRLLFAWGTAQVCTTRQGLRAPRV